MVLDFHNNFIYQNIFKTASTAVATILSKLHKNECEILSDKDNGYTNSLQLNLGSHYTFKEFKKLFPRIDLEKFNIFTLVRNPWDRTVSMYKHYQQDSYFSVFSKEERANKARELTFDKFLKMEWVHLPTQWDLITLDDLIIVKFIGKVENFKADMQRIFSSLNLEFNHEDFDIKTHESKNHIYARPEMSERVWWHYSWWYTNKQVTFVGVRAEKEIQYFGYVFDDKRHEMPKELKDNYDKENIEYFN